MVKLDVKSPYHKVPIHRNDWWLIWMVWEEDLYIDTALPFGLRSAPKIYLPLPMSLNEWSSRRGQC